MSKKSGLDAANCIAEIALGHDVGAVEYGAGAVTRHAHHHRLGNAEPSLTGYGYVVAQERLGKELLKVPRHDVSPQFLKHSILLSEFFLGLVPQDGKHPAKIPTHFRWIPGEYLDLPFSEYMPENRKEKRRLQPDTVLEIPSLRKRYFAEIETRSATIWEQAKLTSTLAKLNPYSHFLRGYAGNVHHGIPARSIRARFAMGNVSCTSPTRLR